jgi:hypothetical protein
MSNNKYDPVILSVIRNTMANLIAEEICSVQPMSNPHSTEEWPYQIDVLPFAKYADVIPMKQWCRETLNEDEWTATVQYFAFKTEEAYSWFKLRWL